MFIDNDCPRKIVGQGDKNQNLKLLKIFNFIKLDFLKISCLTIILILGLNNDEIAEFLLIIFIKVT